MNFEEFCSTFNFHPNSEQAKAVKKTEGPTLMISIPGSGKTTVIIHRIAYMILCCGIPEDKILTVTFSVDAARSMEKRFMEKFGDRIGYSTPTFSTIHSLAYRIVKEYCREYKRKPFRIVDSISPVLRRLICEQTGVKHVNENVIQESIGRISKASNLMLDDEQIGEIKIKGVDFPRLYKDFEEYKRSRSIMDFDDILLYALKILRKYHKILSIFQDEYSYFNVDEAQDNSLVQNEIINLLASGSGNLFMVGDEDQCIYGFRGAYPESFFEFAEKYGGENVIKLQMNYRSRHEILAHAGSFIAQNEHRYEKKLNGVKRGKGNVVIKSFPTLTARNEYIAHDSELIDTAAVLSRNNDSLISVIHYMKMKSLKFNLKGGKNDFFSSVAIKDIIHILRYSINPDSIKLPVHLKRLITDRDMINVLSDMGPADAISYIVKDMKFSELLLAIARKGNSVQNLCSKLNTLQEIAGFSDTLEDFLSDVESLSSICVESFNGGNLSLMTCHGSKGLEFKKVYIIDAYDGIFPCCDANDADTLTEYEEEVRLFYVALTRAEDEVEILNVNKPHWGIQEPSIFVKEIQKGIKT